MEFKEIFPTILGIKQLDYIPDSYVYDCIKYVQNLDKNPLSPEDYLTIEQQLLNNPFFLPLKKEIIKYSLLYVKKLGITVENLQISNSWGYVVKKNNKIDNIHSHYNSLLSGVIYLSPGSPLNFHSSFYEDLYLKTNPTTEEQYLQYNFEVPTKLKQLILFPSHLEHSVSPHNLDNERVSIAFNIIPKGNFGAQYKLINFK